MNLINPKDKNKILKEIFLIKYCKEKGWNPNELTTGQMMKIVSLKEYKNIK